MLRRTSLFAVLSVVFVFLGHAQSPLHTGCEGMPNALNCKLIEDFESDTPGEPPSRWRGTKSRELVPLSRQINDKQSVYVQREGDNQFARIYTNSSAFRVAFALEKNELSWNLDKRPVLQWKWRAKELPDGGNEKYNSSNDTGGAVYVTFDTDWLGRPKSIKYTYSSTLPVGTTVDYGVLKVLVVASGEEQGVDEWIRHERNVVEDYKELFGDTPDKTPLGVMIWGDSDTLEETSKVDFDDLLLLSAPSSDG